MANFGSLTIDDQIFNFINDDLLSGLDMTADKFWSGFEKIITEFAPRNRALVARRCDIQKQIDDWHIARRGQPHDAVAYKQFLNDIGYLVAEPDDFEISTANVDAEIAACAGPQLVVPVNNARYALNAANARWGSLYDALYGTDAIGDEDGAERGGAYNRVRGAKVVAWAAGFLDRSVPLANGSHEAATGYVIKDGQCVVTLSSGEKTVLDSFIGYSGSPDEPSAILCRHNGLHIKLAFDANSANGKRHKAGLSDVIIEAALSTIMDCEDSVTAVDAQDKVKVYGNWLGLMRGDLAIEFSKGGEVLKRTLNADRQYLDADGKPFSVSGRAVMFARNVGLLMTTQMITYDDGKQIPECIADMVINACSALYDLKFRQANSRTGSVYFVVPKMHGPEEVSFANDLFGAVEAMLGLDTNTLKMGIMDEERRTSVNLKACIYQARERVCFINTGFLDRTGDEIHTSMQAGPMVRKGEMKSAVWIKAYEDWNVDIGLNCGLSGKAQIGKGMWAMPDLMADMLDQKLAHLEAGATTSWVPSPTAAILHATHYHQINVHGLHDQIGRRERASLDDLLTIPLADGVNWSDEEIGAELENNAQGILGYMVRWVEQGIGCSTVPDINNIGLMEDRATLRISSQHMANWLVHGVSDKQQVLAAMEKMAAVVDGQNAGDLAYRNMAPDVDKSIAFQAACDLVCRGMDQPSGYTEPVLHARRIEFKGL